MPFDTGAFVSVLAGGTLVALVMYRLFNRVGSAVNETQIKTVVAMVDNIDRRLRQLHEEVVELRNDVEALKLDVAQLHDAIHQSLTGDQRSEMEDWD